MLTNCSLLASALSAAYHSPAKFGGNSTRELQDYMSTNGLLVSMCMGVNSSCTPLPQSAHWSGSWVSEGVGFNIVAGTLIGMVADPHALDLRCVYPTDGGTDGRDDGGCGPLALDPFYGSGGAKALGPLGRARAALKFKRYFHRRFGSNTTWKDVTCLELFGAEVFRDGTSWQPKGKQEAACAAMKASYSNDTIQWEPMISVYERAEQAIVGKPVCSVKDPDPNFGPSNFLEYDGFCSWEPGEFAQAYSWMLGFKRQYQNVKQWNEVVAKPVFGDELRASARALFFIRPIGADAKLVEALAYVANQNAIALGGKPVLVLDVAKAIKTGTLFECYKPSSAAPLVGSHAGAIMTEDEAMALARSESVRGIDLLVGGSPTLVI